jgi:hypothetical protein
VVTRDLPKVETTGSSPVARSKHTVRLPGELGFGRAPFRFFGAVILSLALALAGPVGVVAGPSGPTSSFPDRSTLSILRGEGAYSEQARRELVGAIDGQDVFVGDRLITGPDSNLILTFFEGSTFTLTPNTDVIVERMQGDRTQRDISVRLNAGTIWARVVSFAGSISPFQVRAPNASAVVRGSQIGARVLPDGSFQCWTREGEMSVIAGSGQQVDLVPGETVLVQPDGQLSATRPFEPAASVLRFIARGPVFPVVVHPDGGANGIVDPGIVVSQTFGALVTPPRQGDEGYAFEVPANVSGIYTVVIEGAASAGPGSTYGVLATGLMADPEERLLAGAEIFGPISAGERIAVDLEVQVDRQGQPDALLTSLSVVRTYAADAPLGPARVLVSPIELEQLGR